MIHITFETNFKINLIKAFRACFVEGKTLPLKETKDMVELGIILGDKDIGPFFREIVPRVMKDFAKTPYSNQTKEYGWWTYSIGKVTAEVGLAPTFQYLSSLKAYDSSMGWSNYGLE